MSNVFLEDMYEYWQTHIKDHMDILKATESIPVSISEATLTVTLPEGTEAFKGQIRASNGVLYKISVEKAEE